MPSVCNDKWRNKFLVGCFISLQDREVKDDHTEHLEGMRMGRKDEGNSRVCRIGATAKGILSADREDIGVDQGAFRNTYSPWCGQRR